MEMEIRSPVNLARIGGWGGSYGIRRLQESLLDAGVFLVLIGVPWVYTYEKLTIYTFNSCAAYSV